MASAPLILRTMICLAYIGVGVFVLVYRPFQAAVFDFPFALACFAYGAFRAYRAYNQYKEETEED